MGGRAVFSGLLFPCPAAQRVPDRARGECPLSLRGLDWVGGQGPDRSSDLDRGFDGQPAGRSDVGRVGVFPSDGPRVHAPNRSRAG